MVIEHVDTKFTKEAAGIVISMRFADNPTAEKAKASVELKVPFAALSLDQGELQLDAHHFQPGTFAHTRFQIKALRYMRDALTDEIQRLSNPEGR